MKDRYLSYLSEDERSVLFNLKPGPAAYYEIIARAVIRESGKSPGYSSIFARDVSLLKENDWVGALAGGIPGVTKDPAAVGGGTPRPKAMGLLENPLLTDVKFSKGQTRYSADQTQTNISVGDAIRTLESNGYSKAVSKDGTVTVLQKGDNIYRFYPKSSSDGVPSASLTVAGQKKPVLKIRFVGSENGN
ncbi:hypothetical protein JY452_12015 [Stenotrophomonas maltophilia]|uniref:hypothetical protein n=1 Tax=Stenotrophomonas TaxID=40323 RepID=UPI00122F350B|nr:MULTISPECIES: hypothetical protein [Stenotrophomonas]MBN5126726.1 hypothetical protein [Stenotrophomonas maltophilia]MBN5177833.1 hypothetical protein [Stenotrophomonas maltophilia]MCU1121250.1 hypothetical protein [Stenotrophomonas maltophilia]MDQ7277591.1 hypothetical protein [Stenotrophomonas sp. Sm3147]MDQ7284216.1 hypothetical protein [Stenotrophomonas sp. Sm5341]